MNFWPDKKAAYHCSLSVSGQISHPGFDEKAEIYLHQGIKNTSSVIRNLGLT